jgi:uncharacterized protein DUF3108
MRERMKQSIKYAAIFMGLLLPPYAATGGFPLGGAAPRQSAAGKTAASKKVPAKTNSTVRQTPREPAVPFRVGETLNYRVAWASFTTAASLQVSVSERRQLFGWSTWHFRAALHTQSPVRSLFTIDDEFDSYTDAAVLDTRRYETYQNELGRKEDRTIDFVTTGQKPWGPGPDVIVLPGTCDPVGVLYALRAVDWQRTPQFHAPVYDGHDVYQLTAGLDAKTDTISIAAGTFSASRVAVKLVPTTRQVADIAFEIWLANDPLRTPLQFQAHLPFGTIHAELLPGGK